MKDSATPKSVISPFTRSGYQEHYDALSDQAEERARACQHPKGKLTARERIDLLLDPDSFVEVNRFTGGNMADGFLGAAVITGFGRVDGRTVGVYAQDFSVRGGTLGHVEGQKILHLLQQSLAQRVPIIALLDSGGARIQEGVAALAEYGRIFKATTDASGVVPQISVILGPCAGGAVYCPALTDFIIMTKDSSFMFVTGPDVVKAVTGEDVSSSDLGGGSLHSVESGVAHYLAENEEDALDYARSLLTYLPSHCKENPPSFAFTPVESMEEVFAQQIASIVPEDPKQGYDVVEVIANLVDHGEFVQIQDLFAPSVVIGFACIFGQSIGIVANQPSHDAGTLDVNASEKAARFVQFCDAFNLPVITLVDVPGYRPGSDQERAGIIRRGAKMITAYATATVPLVTVILRKAYGGAFIVMGSKSMGADFNFAWPGAEIAVMGSEGAVDIMYRRQLAQARADGSDVAASRLHFQTMYSAQSINPALSLEKGELDGLIMPGETRKVVADSLRILRTKHRAEVDFKRHDNAPM